MSEARQRVIAYWRTLELLQAPAIPKSSPRDRVYDARSSTPLPWDAGHSERTARVPRSMMRRHVVFCGVFEPEDAYSALGEVFPPDPESVDERPPSRSALAAFATDAEGRPIFGSELVSSCAWSVGQLLRRPTRNPRLEGFEAFQQGFAMRFEELLAAPDGDERAAELRAQGVLVGRPLDLASIERLRQELVQLLGLGDLFDAPGIRIACREMRRARAYGTDDQPLLNSFFADDLNRVADAVGRGDLGAALAAYLSEDETIDERERIDLDGQLEATWEAVAPDRAAGGRWPSAPHQPLALSQQLAVNEALRIPGGGGLFAVNGPPGTGKTTMLRDLVAANVVARADRLAALQRPQDAFNGSERWSTARLRHHVNLWDERLTGFEMVVASANNGAVENVSTEIPGLDAIDFPWRGQADYFADVASSTHAARDGGAAGERQAWGLVAARLGRRSNCLAFNRAFWFGSPSVDRTTAPTMRTFLEAARREPTTAPDWRDAVASYRRAKQAETALSVERRRQHEALAALPDLAQEIAQRAGEAERVGADATAATQRLRAEQAALDAAARDCEQRVEDRRAHAEFRPGFVESLFSLGRAMRTWRAHDQELAALVAVAASERDALTSSVRRLRRQAEACTQLAARCAEAHRGALEREAESLAIVEAARAQLGSALPDERWWSDRVHRELAAPWIDPRWNAARTEVFLAALELHRAFLANAAREILANLRAMVDLLAGKAPPNLAEAAARAMWQTLFFVVPVVSTTFASLPQLFSHLGREAIGWVLIDEAGQATPQAAVGAIWRARRAVLVGDPLQLRPIVQVPFTVQKAMRDAFDVADTWVPEPTSAQAIADRTMRFGAYRGSADQELWVGVPLNVHRRCDDPMFAIANDVAYQGKMVNGTPARTVLGLPASRWIDVPNAPADGGHWIPAEGEALSRLLDALAAAGIDGERVIAVSPFRTVSRRLYGFRGQLPGLNAGTVHQTQGREADVVILVLGSDPRRPGAKVWAAEEPNLLNVAVSRARRRLYVIGDRAAWGSNRHFDVLASRLPRH